MSSPFVGQIEAFGFGFAPKNWAYCRGQLMSITQNQALFALLGTAYGGNGVSTFALPDLRSRLPLGTDNLGGKYPIGATTGTESVTLTPAQMPTHTHNLTAASGTDTTNNTNTPAANVGFGVTTGTDKGGTTIVVNAYALDTAPAAALDPSAVGMTGGNQPHENRMPGMVLNYCISLYGTFPSRN
jgi:microcystin-dependent protein